MNFNESLNILNSIFFETYENKLEYRPEYNTPIELSKCRPIAADNGEINACIEYLSKGATTPVLTRVQVRVIAIKNSTEGKQFLCKPNRFGFQLPGGGYDPELDNGDILATARRELYEEVNIKLTNLQDTHVTCWRYRQDPWVETNVKNPENRWYGYYTFYIVGEYQGEGDNKNPEEKNNWKWKPIEYLYKTKNTAYKKAIEAIKTITEE